MELKNLAKEYLELDKAEKEAKAKKDSVKEQIIEMVGRQSFKNNFLTVSYVEEKSTMKPDVKKMEADGIFENYSMPSVTKESFRISVKEAGLAINTAPETIDNEDDNLPL